MSIAAAAKSDARERAYQALIASYEGNAFGRVLLDEWQQSHPLTEVDAGLALELVMGVSRVRLTAEHIASHFYRGRWAGLRPPLRIILALGIYQLCWLERIPEHAAVDQAVRMAKRHGRGTADMVNAMLRKIAECRGPLIDRPIEPDPRQYLATEPMRGRLFSERIFPDPARRPLDYLIAATGHPPWLVERWHRRFKPEKCGQICQAGRFRPPLVLRANSFRITPDALLQKLKTDHHDARIIEGTQAVLLPEAPSAAALAVVRDGLCQPQDSTSQMALTLSPPKPGEFVLDLCAGVGTKSTQAAELMGNDGVVLASDIDPEKLRKVIESSKRLGLSIVQTVSMEDLDTALARIGRVPDLILIDAPCTNTGVLARRPEARYRAGQRSLTALTQTQRELLERAVALAGPQTRIIYTTCSLEKEENEDQARRFREQNGDWEMSGESSSLPDLDRGGGYAAVLTRRSNR